MRPYPLHLRTDFGPTYRYREYFDDSVYLYQISVMWWHREAEISISKQAVTIMYRDGTLHVVNLLPEKFLGERKHLSQKELLLLIDKIAQLEIAPERDSALPART